MSQHCILLPHIYVVAMAFHVAAWNLASEASPSTPIDESLYKAVVEPSGEFRVNKPLQGEPLVRSRNQDDASRSTPIDEPLYKAVVEPSGEFRVNKPLQAETFVRGKNQDDDMNRVAAEQEEKSMMQEDMFVKKEENVVESNAITGKAWGGKGKGSSSDDDNGGDDNDEDNEEDDNEGDDNEEGDNEEEDVEEDDNDGEDKDDDNQERKDRYCKGVKNGCEVPGAGTRDCCKEFGCRRRRRGGSCNARRRLSGDFPQHRRRIKDPACDDLTQTSYWFVKDGKKCSDKDPATRMVDNAKKKARKTVNNAKKKITGLR